MAKVKLLRSKAQSLINPILKDLKRYGNIEVCGSFRRNKEIVGDIDLLGNNPDMINRLLKYGTHISSGSINGFINRKGVDIDLKIVPKESWGTGLMMWTGSKFENIRLRGIAKAKGLRLNEYGLFKGNKNLGKNKTEEQVYKLIGEKYKKPEER
jgi:DNA polymerase (family 10)